MQWVNLGFWADCIRHVCCSLITPVAVISWTRQLFHLPTALTREYKQNSKLQMIITLKGCHITWELLLAIMKYMSWSVKTYLNSLIVTNHKKIYFAVSTVAALVLALLYQTAFPSMHSINIWISKIASHKWFLLMVLQTLTLKHRETHGCVVSTLATDALVLKHQDIRIHNAD